MTLVGSAADLVVHPADVGRDVDDGGPLRHYRPLQLSRRSNALTLAREVRRSSTVSGGAWFDPGPLPTLSISRFYDATFKTRMDQRVYLNRQKQPIDVTK